MNKKNLIILTAGGSGGHVYPAQALAEELVESKISIALITDTRGKSNYKGMLSQIPNYSVPCGALVGKSKLFKLKSLFKTGFGVIKAIFLLLKLRPKCVIGFGGYAAFPACCAAIITKTPLIIHEQNAVMSRTNRLLAKYATTVATTFKDTKFAPKKTSVLVGLPIRKEIITAKNSKQPKKDKFNILVLGGSQGATIFSKVVPSAIIKLSKKEQENISIIAQARDADATASKKLYAKTNAEYKISSFFNNMPELYKNADLIISRTGASSVYEIAIVGRASLLVPLPTSADNHQFYNAQMLKDSSYIVEQKDFSPLAVSKIISEFINDKEKQKLWEKNAYNKAITNSAKLFKDLVTKGTQHV